MEMRFSKKLVAWLMTATMAAALVPTSALAAEPGEQTGTAAETETTVDETSGVSEDSLTEESTAGTDETVEIQSGETGETPEVSTQAEDENVLPESAHDYENNADQTWAYSLENANDGVVITFDAQTETENNYDFIYIMDGNGNTVGEYTGTALAGAKVAVPTSSFTIRLTSDSTGQRWGFKVTDVTAVEKGNLEQEGTTSVARIPSQMLTAENPVAKPVPVVTYLGKELTAGEDFTVSYENNDKAGTATVTIEGTGDYRGTLTAEFLVAAEDNLIEAPVTDADAKVSLRQTGDTGRSYIQFNGVTEDWADHITSVTLTPVEDKDDTPTVAENGEYPQAPKEITLGADDISVSGNNIYFNRTAEDPVVYVMEGHQPIEIVGRWSTVTYPQSQIYKVTVEADNYETASGYVTYYTGTAPAFSIIIEEEDGTQTTVASWSSEEIQEMATFANGSSQCGMTGFRTFSGMGVTLKDLLEDAGVTVSEDDYFLLDTSDHYGNNFTYDQLFGTTRYFLEGIYDEGFEDIYHELVSQDDEAGANRALRRYLAEQCLEDESVVEPRINVNYVESLISGDNIGSAVMPTEENTEYNSLICYENQFRFFYGISLTQDECEVTFDTQGGSDVASQTVLSHLMTSTENTTIKSSYWANSLVIYRGQGDEHQTEPSTAADSITVPEVPTRDGYVFGGWYTDPECTNRFDFNSNDGTVEEDTTLYARWIPEDEAITVTDFDITNAEHDDADGELNQTIIATIDFSEPIQMNAEQLANELDIRIAGGSVADTARNVTYEINPENPNQLIITMVSTDWAAIYNGMLTIDGSEITGLTPADGSDKEVLVNHLEGRIPIGIIVNNDVLAQGTDTACASTYVNVAHKANMRGMYFFELVSIVDGQETVIGSSVSHAHNFYTTIDEAAIASAMASAIDGYDGYSTTYTDGNTYFIVTADNPKAGETIAVRMQEYDAEINYAEHTHVPVTDPAVPATETDTGLTEGSHCEICGEVLVAQNEIPALSGQTPGQSDNQNPAQSTDQTNGSNGTSAQQTTVGAKTGDTNALYLYVVVALAGCAAVGVMVRRRITRR